MSILVEPESWLGLRSERAVAGDFTATSPAATAAPNRREPTVAGHLSWPAIRAVFHRTIGMILGR